MESSNDEKNNSEISESILIGESKQEEQLEGKREGKNDGTEASSAVTKSVTPPELPLDWTKLGKPADEAMPLRYPHDVAEINPEDLDIVVVGTAGQKITVLGNDFSAKCNPKLEQLILRSHLIRTMQGLDQFSQLELLELYDNMIDELACLDSFGPTLKTLDMSYNVIRDMSPVAICPNLKELYLANNKLKSMAGLGGLSQLRKLDLGANRIRVMDENELSGLVNLEELWIGKNKIEKMNGLDKLTKLRRLDIQSNRLVKIENLTTQQNTLEELYLAHNAITCEGATSEATGLKLVFPNLNVLDLSRNRLTSTAPFAHLSGLEELWLSGNQIATFEDVKPLKQITSEETKEEGKTEVPAQVPTPQLETLYLEYNPIAKEFEYRKRLAEWIPSLKQIDATMIGGLAAHGIPAVPTGGTGSVETLEQQMRRLQQAAISRAQAEAEAQRRIEEQKE